MGKYVRELSIYGEVAVAMRISECSTTRFYSQQGESK